MGNLNVLFGRHLCIEGAKTSGFKTQYPSQCCSLCFPSPSHLNASTPSRLKNSCSVGASSHRLSQRSQLITPNDTIVTYDALTAVFADGSKTPKGVGCAFIPCRETRSFLFVLTHDDNVKLYLRTTTCLVYYTRSFSLSRSALIFSSELFAIEKVSCFIDVSEDSLSLILWDSLSSLFVVWSLNPDDPIVLGILTRLTSV